MLINRHTCRSCDVKVYTSFATLIYPAYAPRIKLCLVSSSTCIVYTDPVGAVQVYHRSAWVAVLLVIHFQYVNSLVHYAFESHNLILRVRQHESSTKPVRYSITVPCRKLVSKVDLDPFSHLRRFVHRLRCKFCCMQQVFNESDEPLDPELAIDNKGTTLIHQSGAGPKAMRTHPRGENTMSSNRGA